MAHRSMTLDPISRPTSVVSDRDDFYFALPNPIDDAEGELRQDAQSVVAEHARLSFGRTSDSTHRDVEVYQELRNGDRAACCVPRVPIPHLLPPQGVSTGCAQPPVLRPSRFLTASHGIVVAAPESISGCASADFLRPSFRGTFFDPGVETLNQVPHELRAIFLLELERLAKHFIEFPGHGWECYHRLPSGRMVGARRE
jgi:hypothetical protein